MDRLTGWLLCAMVVFSPWALGSVPRWAIWTMNVGGYLLGLLWLVQKVGRWRRVESLPRWNQNEPLWIARTLAGLTIGLLVWTLISALNAKSFFVPVENRLQDYPWHIPWLPHSYDGPSTWFALWMYLGLACVFWAARDWLTTVTADERQRWEATCSQTRILKTPVNRTRFGRCAGTERASEVAERMECGGSPPLSGLGSSAAIRSEPYLPRNLRTLLWVLSINGGILAVVSIAQRLDGTPKLLWLFPGPGVQAQFGPFNYRANAAQYFNLLWPLTLGFWWALGVQRSKYAFREPAALGGARLQPSHSLDGDDLARSQPRPTTEEDPTAIASAWPATSPSFERIGGSPRILLPLAVIGMAAAPFISTTRGGAFIATGLLLTVAILFAFAPKHQVGWRRWVGLGACTMAALLGLYLGWGKLEPRLFKPQWARPLNLTAPVNGFVLRMRVKVPDDPVTNWTHLVSLSDSDRYSGNQPGAFMVVVGRGGELTVRQNGLDGTKPVSITYPCFAGQYAGREVEVVVHRGTNLTVEVDGEALTAREATAGASADWGFPVQPRFLVIGGRVGPAPDRSYRLLSVRLERALDALSGTADRLGLGAQTAHENAVAAGDVLAFVDDAQNPKLRFFMQNTADWSGRQSLYENARAMALGLPVLFGAGPGTFGALLLAYATVQGGPYHPYAHDDWLQARITFGVLAMGCSCLGLVVVVMRPLRVGGIVVPRQLVWVIWLGLGGCLVHALFDYPLQVHSIGLLLLLQLGILSLVQCRP